MKKMGVELPVSKQAVFIRQIKRYSCHVVVHDIAWVTGSKFIHAEQNWHRYSATEHQSGANARKCSFTVVFKSWVLVEQ